MLNSVAWFGSERKKYEAFQCSAMTDLHLNKNKNPPFSKRASFELPPKLLFDECDGFNIYANQVALPDIFKRHYFIA
jgi:hypothetical protein